MSRTRCSSNRPSAPSSENPAEMTIAPLAPASTQARTCSGTVAAGVAITARSTASGTAFSVG